MPVVSGGLQLSGEQGEDSFHFLVFTDLLGNRTHGVVVQSYRAVQVIKPTGFFTKSNLKISK